MWLFNRQPKLNKLPLFDEGFLRRLERLSFRTAPSLRGEMGGERRSRNLRPALDFSDHRPYSPGDDLRHVDWNAYSRHEDLFVKLGEASQSVNVHILLDASPSMVCRSFHSVAEAPGPDAQKWIAARRLAGALGYLGLSGGERVEIASFAAGLHSSFGPTQGKKQAISLLNYVTAITDSSLPKTGADPGGLVASLSAYARKHPHGGLLILISDLLDTAGGDDRQLAEALRFFSPPRWQVLVLHLLTEQEIDPTLEGDFDLRDVETGQSLPFHLDDATLAQYRLRVKSWCRQLQTAAAQRAAIYARVLAEWPLEKSVIPYLRQRGAVQ
jgi:uncharacterized protein (DUF58 family)